MHITTDLIANTMFVLLSLFNKVNQVTAFLCNSCQSIATSVFVSAYELYGTPRQETISVNNGKKRNPTIGSAFQKQAFL